MSPRVHDAIAAIQALPAAEQETIASLIFEELADERRWEESFAKSQAKLARMAEEVRKQINSGQTRDTGIDEL